MAHVIRSLVTLYLLAASNVTAIADPSATQAGDLVNFHEVNDDLFRSGTLSRDAIAELRDQGIKTIISLEDYNGSEQRAERESRWARAAGITFKWLPMHSYRKPSVAQIEDALYAIQSAHKPVLVHCKRGKDRTGIVVGAYRIRHEQWSVESAIRELRSYGHSQALYWWDDVLNEFD